jgi:hypothetical protein
MNTTTISPEATAEAAVAALEPETARALLGLAGRARRSSTTARAARIATTIARAARIVTTIARAARIVTTIARAARIATTTAPRESRRPPRRANRDGVGR